MNGGLNESEVIYDNGKYQVIRREYMVGHFIYDLKSLMTGNVYESYTANWSEAIDHADWYSKN